MIVRSRRIGELAFSDGDKLRSAFNVGAITELIFFQGESHEIYGSYLEIGSGRNKVWLIGESYLA